VLAGLASIFGAFQPANVTSTRFRFTLPQLAISVTEDKKYNSANFILKTLQRFGDRQRHLGIERCNDWGGEL
jgi:hypothetical protein